MFDMSFAETIKYIIHILFRIGESKGSVGEKHNKTVLALKFWFEILATFSNSCISCLAVSALPSPNQIIHNTNFLNQDIVNY